MSDKTKIEYTCDLCGRKQDVAADGSRNLTSPPAGWVRTYRGMVTYERGNEGSHTDYCPECAASPEIAVSMPFYETERTGADG